LAIGAPLEDSNAVGVGGNQADDSAQDAGAVYEYAWQGNAWIPKAYVKASNTDAGDQFGSSLALSSDASTLAIGASLEDSNAAGIDGDQTNDAVPDSGAVYVYAWEGNAWMQQAYVKASNTDMGDQFGSSLALSSDASTLVVSASQEASGAAGIGGNQSDNSAAAAGTTYLY